jgi:single-stranded DNA-specific DHH superfamily exonuclease
MALTTKEIKKFREDLASSYCPLVFFDDDPDGLTSFLQIYKEVGDGRGVVLKTKPELAESFAKRAEELNHDMIFVLDIPSIEQEFLDRVKTKVLWLDHHSPLKRTGVDYYNPRNGDDKDNRPTSYWVYKIIKKNIWVAMVGCVGDWQLPDDITKAFRKEYPDLLPKEITTPEKALFESKIGLLAKVFSFNLMGKTQDAMKSVKILTRIKSPYEILDQTTPRGKFIWKRFQVMNKDYEDLIGSIKVRKSDKILLHIYEETRMSFTGDLSNELLYRNPDKIIIVGRSKSGETKCSLRSASAPLAPILKKALVGIEGYGGGHKFACGACIKDEDFKKFISNLKKELK